MCMLCSQWGLFVFLTNVWCVYLNKLFLNSPKNEVNMLQFVTYQTQKYLLNMFLFSKSNSCCPAYWIINCTAALSCSHPLPLQSAHNWTVAYTYIVVTFSVFRLDVRLKEDLQYMYHTLYRQKWGSFYLFEDKMSDQACKVLKSTCR